MRTSGGFSLGLVALGSFVLGCSERQITAPSGTPSFVASAAPEAGQAACEHVAGAFVFSMFQFTSQTTAVGEGTVAGDLSGTFGAQYFDIQQQGSGVVQMHAHHTITRSAGTIRTSDVILLLPDQDPAVALPNSRLDIVGGTGGYDGASGLLHTRGNVNLGTLAGSIEFKGQICVP